MVNKAQIIQRLLDEKHITVEEAMVLMEKEFYTHYPFYYNIPQLPHFVPSVSTDIPIAPSYTITSSEELKK